MHGRLRRRKAHNIMHRLNVILSTRPLRYKQKRHNARAARPRTICRSIRCCYSVVKAFLSSLICPRHPCWRIKSSDVQARRRLVQMQTRCDVLFQGPTLTGMRLTRELCGPDWTPINISAIYVSLWYVRIAFLALVLSMHIVASRASLLAAHCTVLSLRQNTGGICLPLPFVQAGLAALLITVAVAAPGASGAQKLSGGYIRKLLIRIALRLSYSRRSARHR